MTEILTPARIKQFVSGERVSLVGGAGFIGHNLAVGLRQAGAEVQVVDNLMFNNLPRNVSIAESSLDRFRRNLYQDFLLQRFERMRAAGVFVTTADARSMTDLIEVFNDFQPTKIVHLVGISSALDARKVPGLCFDLQLVTLRNVLEYTRLFPNRVTQVVFFSSSTVYGDFETPSVDENVRPKPRGIYANAKYMGERLVRTYNDQYGLGVNIIRPSALYGERCISGRVSQKFIENALMGKPLYLDGGGDGRLDFTYIEDLVDGMTRAIALPTLPGGTHTFNITFGNARTILDLANIVKSVVPNAIFEKCPRDQIRPVRGTLSIDRARDVLSFEPQWPLEKGYKRYCEWYVDQWERTQHRLAAN